MPHLFFVQTTLFFLNFILFLNCNLSVYIGLDVIESTTNINSVNVGNIPIRFDYEFKMSMNCFTPTVALLDVLGENILNHYKQHDVTQISKKCSLTK